MKVLKDFKTVNQVFKAGDEFYDDIDGLENWVARHFVAVEELVDGAVVAPVAPTEVPTVTFA